MKIGDIEKSEIRELAIKNAKDKNKGAWFSYANDKDILDESLGFAFEWGLSPQGKEFWQKVDKGESPDFLASLPDREVKGEEQVLNEPPIGMDEVMDWKDRAQSSANDMAREFAFLNMDHILTTCQQIKDYPSRVSIDDLIAQLRTTIAAGYTLTKQGEGFSKQLLIDYLLKEGYLKQEHGFSKVAPIKPYHGNCCCCQECGQQHDDCVCGHNRWIDTINSFESVSAPLIEAEGKWIAVTDKLPKEEHYVLVCFKVSHGIDIALTPHQYVNGKWYGYFDPNPEHRITHWQELPQPPKQ